MHLASVRHRQAHLGLLHEAVRHATKDPLAKPAVSIASGNDEIGANVRSETNPARPTCPSLRRGPLSCIWPLSGLMHIKGEWLSTVE